jgi:hypothetical protein
MSSGDADAVEAFYSMADGVAFVGTGDAEFWTDSAKHNADVRHFFDGSEGVLRWRATDPIAMREGSAGWTFDRTMLELPDGSNLRARVTLVWRLEGERWLVVHSHASVGRP